MTIPQLVCSTVIHRSFENNTQAVHNTPILYGGDHIKIVQESTCLGLQIDNRLDWKPQVQNVCKSFSKKLGALKRMRCLPKQS